MSVRFSHRRTVARIVFGYVTLLVACVGLAFTTLMLMFLALLTFTEDGFICPDGGEEVWTRPGVLNYLPPVLVGIGLTVFVAWRLRRRLPAGAGLRLPHARAGPVHVRHDLPRRPYPQPGDPVLVAAYVAALVTSAATTFAARRRGTAGAR